jgi:hypothetical protein
MFAYRWTWIIKQGRMKECLELNTTTPGLRSKEYAKIRYYTPSISPQLFVVEMVVENEEIRAILGKDGSLGRKNGRRRTLECDGIGRVAQ